MQSHFSHTDHVTLFGALFIAAFVVNWWLARRNAQRVGIDASHIDLLLPLAITGGIAGGIGFALLPPQDFELAGAAAGVDIRLRLFGIVVSGAIVLFVYSRIAKLSFRTLLDVFALPTIAAIAVHRLGCFFAGCCWGDLSVVEPGPAGSEVMRQIQTVSWLAGDWVFWGATYGPGTWPYEQQLAVGLIGPEALRSLAVHPVQLYEVALLVAAYLVLRRVPLEQQRPGLVAAAASIAYAVGRFALEYLRADGALVLGNLTLVQLQCLLLVAITAVASRYAIHGSASRPLTA